MGPYETFLLIVLCYAGPFGLLFAWCIHYQIKPTLINRAVSKLRLFFTHTKCGVCEKYVARVTCMYLCDTCYEKQSKEYDEHIREEKYKAILEEEEMRLRARHEAQIRINGEQHPYRQ